MWLNLYFSADFLMKKPLTETFIFVCSASSISVISWNNIVEAINGDVL